MAGQLVLKTRMHAKAWGIDTSVLRLYRPERYLRKGKAMSVLVINPSGEIIGHGISAVRGDFQGEKGLIKVTVGAGEYDFHYIGTTDRDTYTFVTMNLPAGFDPTKFTVVGGKLKTKG
jgi:hypothetical protein